jgi:hypothetical protein
MRLVMAFQMLHRAPGGGVAVAADGIQHPGDDAEIDPCVPPERGCCQGAAYGVSESVMPSCVEARSSLRDRTDDPWINWPILRDLDHRSGDEVSRVGHVAAVGRARRAARPKDNVDAVMAQAIDAELAQEIGGIVNKVLFYPLTPERKYRPADMLLLGEELAIVRITVGPAVIKPEALFLPLDLIAHMVVHDVKEHRDTVQVQNIDHRLELI